MWIGRGGSFWKEKRKISWMFGLLALECSNLLRTVRLKYTFIFSYSQIRGQTMRVQQQDLPEWRELPAQLQAPVHLHRRGSRLHSALPARALPATLGCANPRLVKVPGQCCEEWVCDDGKTKESINKLFGKRSDGRRHGERPHQNERAHLHHEGRTQILAW